MVIRYARQQRKLHPLHRRLNVAQRVPAKRDFMRGEDQRMLYCSISSGEHFDRRARELRQGPSVVEGIIQHANPRKRSEPQTH